MKRAVIWNLGQVWIQDGERMRDGGVGHLRQNWKTWCNRHGYKFVDVSGIWPAPEYVRRPRMRCVVGHGLQGVPEVT